MARRFLQTRYNQTVPALRLTKVLSLTLARLTLPLAALLTLLCASAAAQDPAAPPDTTQPPAPIVRTAPRPKAIMLPAPGTSSTVQATPNAPRQNNSTVLESATPTVKRQAGPISGTTTSPTGAISRPVTPGFTSKILTTPYKPNANAPLIQLSPGPFNRQVIFLDPAHGGNDSGSRIEDSILEKDVTLQLAFKLRSLLAARGFTVVLSREADAATQPNAPDTPLTLDARAGIGNHARPVACLLRHATGSGRGVHL